MSINVCLEMNPISREIELQNTLKNTGIGFQNSNKDSEYPYQIKQIVEGYNPAIAIWGESQIPTDEEIELIQSLAKKEIEFFPQKNDLSAKGFCTTTLYKIGDNNWTYKGMARMPDSDYWPEAKAPLIDICKEISPLFNATKSDV